MHVKCVGCGGLMDMNDAELRGTVMTYEVYCINETFFFHDGICVALRKYKEIIRKYMVECDPDIEPSHNVPQYIKVINLFF